MSEANRFSGLMGGLNQSINDEPAKTVEAKKITKSAVKQQAKAKTKGKRSTVKSRDPGYIQMGLYLPEELHRKMKAAAAINGLEMSDVAAQAVELWLSKNAPNI